MSKFIIEYLPQAVEGGIKPIEVIAENTGHPIERFNTFGELEAYIKEMSALEESLTSNS